MRTCISTISLAVALAISSALLRAEVVSNDPFKDYSSSLTAVPETLTNRGDVYVPVFSTIRIGAGLTRLNLAVTLSIHNVSESDPLVISRINYLDTSGMLIQSYVTKPIAIRPFSTVEIFIAADDVRGGTGAKFLVTWAAKGPIPEPVVEAVMGNFMGTGGVAFSTHGRSIRISQ